MKKIVMIAFVAAATLSFAACNTKTEGAQGTPADSIPAVVEAPVVETVTADTTALGKYETLVNNAIALVEKANAGDATAKADAAKLTKDIATSAADLKKNQATMTPEQKAKFDDLSKKFADATKAPAKK